MFPQIFKSIDGIQFKISSKLEDYDLYSSAPNLTELRSAKLYVFTENGIDGFPVSIKTYKNEVNEWRY